MQAVVQSSFLQALAFALLNSVWQMALLWLVLLFIFLVFNLSASQKFNVAFAAQLTGFILFIYCLIHACLNKNFITGFADYNSAYINKLQFYIKLLMPYTGIVYLVLLTWQFIKLLMHFYAAQSIRNLDLKKISAGNRIFVQQLTSLLSLKKKVNIYISSKIKCPFTVGFLKPVILIPLAAVNYLTKEQMEAVILHELTHVKRYDYLFNLIQSFIDRIFFFNVFSGMIYEIIERERENACDDFVLQFKYNSFHYAEALLKLGKLQTTNAFAMAASGKKENILLLRIKRLVHGKSKSLTYGYASLAKFFFIVMITLPLVFILLTGRNSTQLKIVGKPLTVISAQKKPEAVTAVNIVSQIKFVPKALATKPAQKQLQKNADNLTKINIKPANNIITPVDVFNVRQSSDSLQQLTYDQALNKQLVINEDFYNKVLSYENFKQLEAMLYASGNSINITEDPASKASYKKLITIEATDAKGNKNVYKVIVELYQ